jgi:hypothetical protein
MPVPPAEVDTSAAVNIETVLSPRLATATNGPGPAGLTATDAGASPVPTRGPGTGEGKPCSRGNTKNGATSLAPVSAVTSTYAPDAIDWGLAPVANGEPPNGENVSCAAAAT